MLQHCEEMFKNYLPSPFSIMLQRILNGFKRRVQQRLTFNLQHFAGLMTTPMMSGRRMTTMKTFVKGLIKSSLVMTASIMSRRMTTMKTFLKGLSSPLLLFRENNAKLFRQFNRQPYTTDTDVEMHQTRRLVLSVHLLLLICCGEDVVCLATGTDVITRVIYYAEQKECLV